MDLEVTRRLEEENKKSNLPYYISDEVDEQLGNPKLSLDG